MIILLVICFAILGWSAEHLGGWAVIIEIPLMVWFVMAVYFSGTKRERRAHDNWVDYWANKNKR